MKNQILTERPNLFEPDAYIGFVLLLKGVISCERVKDAVRSAYQTNETTMSRIVLTEDGSAFYKKMEESGCIVDIANDSFEKIFANNKKKPFNLKEGELVRTFIIPKEQEITILIMVHHLAGDGKAIARFAEEILELLDGKSLSYCSADILSKEEINRKGALPAIYRILIQRFNAKWGKNRKVFSWDDYEMIHSSFWKNRCANLQVKWINQDELSNIKKSAKNAGLTVNTWLVTKLQEEQQNKRMIGIPISVRESNGSMNNMTSGIRIKHAYNQKQTFIWNAKQIHKKIGKRLSNRHVKYLAISFVSEVDGSLVDGVLMQLHRLYNNPITQKMSMIMGYSGKRKTQLGITNLGIIDIPVKHKDYSVEKVLCIPPKVSYADQTIGISTFRNQVCIAQNSIEDEN